MGVAQTVLSILVIATIIYFGMWARRRFMPLWPIVIDYCLWTFGIIVIILIVAQALGIPLHDPKVPKLKVSSTTARCGFPESILVESCATHE